MHSPRPELDYEEDHVWQHVSRSSAVNAFLATASRRRFRARRFGRSCLSF